MAAVQVTHAQINNSENNTETAEKTSDKVTGNQRNPSRNYLQHLPFANRECLHLSDSPAVAQNSCYFTYGSTTDRHGVESSHRGSHVQTHCTHTNAMCMCVCLPVFIFVCVCVCVCAYVYVCTSVKAGSKWETWEVAVIFSGPIPKCSVAISIPGSPFLKQLIDCVDF